MAFDPGGGFDPGQFDPGVPSTPDWVREAEAGANFNGRLTPWQEAGMSYPEYAVRVGEDRAYEDALRAFEFAQLIGGGPSGPTQGQFLTDARQREQLAEQQRQFGLTFPEEQRQFNETFGYNKAAFNIGQQLEEARFGWQQAVDARDFEAAEAWRQRYHQLDQARFGQQQYTDEAQIAQAQNRQAFDYINLLASQRGPRDYGAYWYTSRGLTPPQGTEPIPFEQAIPTAFQPRTVPTRQSFLGTSGPAFAPQVPQAAQRAPAFVAQPAPAPAPAPPAELITSVGRNDQRRNIPTQAGTAEERARGAAGAVTAVAPIGGVTPQNIQPARTISLATGVDPEDFLRRLAPYNKPAFVR